MQTCFEIEKGQSTILVKAEPMTEITFNGDVTYTGGYCGRYALLYQNAFGGYDSYLLEGSVYRESSLVMHNYAKSYDNTTLERETTNYANEITTTWTCNTGWLTDEQSARLVKHLLSSPDIYLQDIEEDRFVPVQIATTSYKHKTYQNEGKRMVNYTIKLKESNIKTRQN